MPLAAAIPAIIGVGGSIAGGLIGSSGAKKAANAQAQAAEYAANLQHQDTQQALQFQQGVYANTQRQFAPWLQTGTNAINRLNALMGLPSNQGTSQFAGPNTTQPGSNFTNTAMFNRIPSVGGAGGPRLNRLAMLDGGAQNDMAMIDGNTGQFMNPDAGTFGGTTATGTGAMTSMPLSALGGDQPFTDWTQQFVAPTDVTEQNDPGFKFRLQQGRQAIENSAAARGGLLSGGTAKALDQYSQDYASNEYGNVYNRALGQFQQGYNIFENNQANTFNRLSSLAGGGQITAGQLSSAGQNAANSNSALLLASGQQQGNAINNAAAARASGYINSASAYNTMLSNLLGYSNLIKLGGGGLKGPNDYPNTPGGY